MHEHIELIIPTQWFPYDQNVALKTLQSAKPVLLVVTFWSVSADVRR